MDSMIVSTLSDADANGYLSIKRLALTRGATDINAVRNAWKESRNQRGLLYVEIVSISRDRLQVLWSASDLADEAAIAAKAKRITERLRHQLESKGRECPTTYSGRRGEHDPTSLTGTIDGLTSSEAEDLAHRLNALKTSAA